jgi:hypothetical protein
MKHGLIVLAVFSWSILHGQDADSSANYDSTYYEDYSDSDGDAESYDGDSAAFARTLVEPEVLTGEYKEEEIRLQKFDSAKWKAIAGSTDFEERDVEVEEQRDLAPPRVPWAGDLMRIIGYAAIIGVVVLLIYAVVKNTRLEKRTSKIPEGPQDAEKAVENIEEFDIDSLLKNALAEHNYRMAVRLYYLGLLKKLNELGIIVWKKDKTNRDYLSELFARDYLYDDVRKLTVAYEQVWYGEHTPSDEKFQGLLANFENVNEKLNREKTS